MGHPLCFIRERFNTRVTLPAETWATRHQIRQL
jgi:hypothetical protein